MSSPRERLQSLEQRIDREAQEYKRRRLAEEMQKLAEREGSALFPPDAGDLPADPLPLVDDDDDRGPCHS